MDTPQSEQQAAAPEQRGASVETSLARRPEVASALRVLEAWVESQMEYRGLPGMSLGIVYDQELIWARGFGYADLEKGTPATPRTLYRIASISKLFAATAALQLRDAGKLELHDPVEKHLPWFRLKRTAPEAPPITLRHLLTHTAGLPRESPFPYWTDARFPTREQLQQALAEQEAVYPPDTKWKYSNLGLSLVGEVVAAVSGQPYEEYVRERILEPLGMASSSVVPTEAQREALATGYGRRMPDGSRALRPFTDAQGITPAAGMTSNVEDLAHFVSLQLRDGPAGGSQILKGSTLREMHRVHWLQPDWKGGFGLGFRILHREHRDTVGHGGWVPGYQTAVVISLREKVAAIALTNADDGHPYPGLPDSIVDRMLDWVAPAITKAVSPPAGCPEPDPEWERYLGKYRDAWGDRQVVILEGKLALIDPMAPDPEPLKLILTPTGGHSFRTESTAPFGEDGDPVVFELDDDGRVVRMKVVESIYDRLG